MILKNLSIPAPIFVFSRSCRTTTSILPSSQFLYQNKFHFHSYFVIHTKTHLNLIPHSTSNPSQSPSSNQHQHTQQAISHLLQQEHGISEQDSIFIASNCPKYANMLIQSVDEFDDLYSNSNSSDNNSWNEFGFQEKLVYLAKQKGDNGKLAVLESLVGLPLTSALNVARYVPIHDSLPLLLLKVNYIKEMFFSGNYENCCIGKNARRMLMHLSIPIDNDLQHTLSLFEKIEARRGGLDMLGSSATFCCLIESFPRILSLPLETHLKPVVEFFESLGIPSQHVGSIFLLFPPIILYGIKVVKIKVLALEKIGAGHEEFGEMIIKYPWILSTSIQNNYKEILSLCDKEKVQKVSIDKAIRSWPQLLGCSTSKLKVIFDEFAHLGVKNKKVSQVIAKSPQLLLRKREAFLQVVSFLRAVGFDQETVGDILVRCPEVFAASVDMTLRGKLEFLTSMGVSEDHLPRTIKKYPELLVSDINRTLLPRMKYLMKEVGLTKKEVVFMVRRFSPLLGYSIDEVLRPKYKFLVETMEKPVKEVVEYPRYFSYSLEKKIKPRYWVLKGRNVECSLKEMLDKNDEEFAAKFMG